MGDSLSFEDVLGELRGVELPDGELIIEVAGGAISVSVDPLGSSDDDPR